MTTDEQRARAPGSTILRLGVVTTAVFLVTQVGADIAPDTPLLAVAVAVSLAMFAVGAMAFVVGFFVAVGRSREEAVTLGGLFLLAGTAPERVRRVLFSTLAAQVVIAVATAAVRPFTPLAFGILAPLLGVGFTGLWAARHGSFFTKEEAQARVVAGAGSGEADSLRGPFDDRGGGDDGPGAGPEHRRRWWEPADDR